MCRQGAAIPSVVYTRKGRFYPQVAEFHRFTMKSHASQKNSEGTTKSIRCYELDWLRVMAVLVLVFFHSSEIFSIGWFHIKNAETSRFFSALSGFIYIWHMPLFFLVAGASTWFALEFRTGRAYVKERMYRLMIPLIFGVLLLIPPQSYFENV